MGQMQRRPFRAGSLLLALAIVLFVAVDLREGMRAEEEVAQRGAAPGAMHDGRGLRGTAAAVAAAADCLMGKWSSYDACDAECGGGHKVRSRAVLRKPRFGGRRCLPTTQESSCNTHACPPTRTAAPRPPAPPTAPPVGAARYHATTHDTGMNVPTFLYGTAWKGAATATAVFDAIAAHGFRGLDTAFQTKHYSEEGVGEALQRAYAETGATRDDFFLQTKFSHGQWRSEAAAGMPMAARVHASVLGSLAHLRTDHLDALLLHGPTNRRAPVLPAADWAAWRAMEAEYFAGRVRSLGVSNVNAAQLADLLAHARVKPEYVQKRAFARSGWERAVRTLCTAHGLLFQPYSLLTANRRVLRNPKLVAIANRHGVTPAQVVFRYALQAGMMPLTGSTDGAHLEQDRAAYGFELSPAEFRTIDTIGGA